VTVLTTHYALLVAGCFVWGLSLSLGGRRTNYSVWHT